MASEQEVEAMRSRLATLEEAEKRRAISTAIESELSKYPVASRAAAGQLKELILPAVDMVKVSDGREIPFVGSDYKPLQAYVAELVAQPTYCAFPPWQGPSGARSVSGAHARSAAVAARGGCASRGGGHAATAGETLGQAVLRRAVATQVQRGDPRLYPSQPMGLGRRGLIQQ